MMKWNFPKSDEVKGFLERRMDVLLFKRWYVVQTEEPKFEYEKWLNLLEYGNKEGLEV